MARDLWTASVELSKSVFRDVKSEKVTITDGKHFASYTNETLNGIKPLYLALEDVLVEQTKVENAPKIADTLKIHKIKRSQMVFGIFFFTTTVTESLFYEHWCKKNNKPDVCEHPELPLLSIKKTCANCRIP